MTTRTDSDHGHQEHVDPAELVPLDRYRSEVLSGIEPLEPIELGLLEAHGCVLAEDVDALADVPAFANSAMDGFAVATEGLSDGAELEVVGEVAAGSADHPEVGRGRAVRIMTGAPIPRGANAVVPVEVASELDGWVLIERAPRAGEHVRPAGEDVRAGETVLAAGRRLRAGDVGMLAAVGRSRVLVRPRPRVTVVSTGDELTEPGVPLRPGQIRDSNSYTLTAMAREAGAVATRHRAVPDDRRALTEAFEGALAHSDLLVTSGGVSAGRYDLVKHVLAELGDVTFRKVGMQPGMPQAFGWLRRGPAQHVPVFGLPGNPVSAYVSFEVFVRPAVRRLQGRGDVNRPRVTAVLAESVRSPAAKVSFLRVRLWREGSTWQAGPTGAQGSGILRSVIDADGLAEIPAERTTVAAGEPVIVHLLTDPS
jgi:molybdopterin molybdotransferase